MAKVKPREGKLKEAQKAARGEREKGEKVAHGKSKWLFPPLRAVFNLSQRDLKWGPVAFRPPKLQGATLPHTLRDTVSDLLPCSPQPCSCSPNYSCSARPILISSCRCRPPTSGAAVLKSPPPSSCVAGLSLSICLLVAVVAVLLPCPPSPSSVYSCFLCNGHAQRSQAITGTAMATCNGMLVFTRRAAVLLVVSSRTHAAPLRPLQTLHQLPGVLGAL